MSPKSPLPKPGTGQALICWVPKAIFPQLDAEAQRRGVSRSTTARQIILGFFTALNGETPAE
jgi:hypothetical protein